MKRGRNVVTDTTQDVTDTKHYARWLLKATHAHCEIEAPDGPHTCEECPWGATTREPYHEISNDPSEAHYLCPVLNKEVWGEGPECRPHQTALLVSILKNAADWDAFQSAEQAEAERVRQEREKATALRESALAKLTDDERRALGV
jgi:hypothetical protein